MNEKLNNTLLLWLTGFSLAIVVLISKQAVQAGMHPIHFAFLQALGSFIFIFVFSAKKMVSISTIKKRFNYFLIASLLGFTLPQLIIFSAVSHVGVGIASLSYSLPLVVAYLISINMRLEFFERKKFLFLLMTVIGTIVYLFKSDYLPGLTENNIWNYIIILVPISLGVANVYRTVKWPSEMTPSSIALIASLFSLVTYFFISILMQTDLSYVLTLDYSIIALLIVQMAFAGLGQLLLFKLQKSAGPVFIGQTGSIVTLFGGVLGYLVYHEIYAYNSLIGSILIIIGVHYYSKLKFANVAIKVQVDK